MRIYCSRITFSSDCVADGIGSSIATPYMSTEVVAAVGSDTDTGGTVLVAPLSEVSDDTMPASTSAPNMDK